MSTPKATEAFDRVAESYDATFESLPGAGRVRQIVHSILLRTFHAGDAVLELNAGTGTDAVLLAERGVRVHASDASPAMVRAAQQKAEARGVADRVTHEVLDFASLTSLRGRVFDGVLSDLGGLNCLPDVRLLLKELAGLVRPGGYAVLCFMPRFSLWETVAFGVRGDFDRARRRWSPAGRRAAVGGMTVQTYYHSPGEVVRRARPAFTHLSTTGLNIFTPPPSSVAASRLLRPLLPLLEWLENRTASAPLVRCAGDHVVVVLRRAP